MSAVKKNIHKLLAAFLCLCLVLSYNPAFGAVDSAFAANDGGEHLTPGLTQEDLDNAVAESGNDEDATRTWDADGSKGREVTTIVQASTYDSTLRSSHRDPFSATVQQLKDGKVGDDDVSYIWFEVTGGTPFPGDDAYHVNWKVYDNNKLSDSLGAWLEKPGIVDSTKNGDVMNYHVNIQELAKNDQFLPDHKYTFVGTFEDKTGKTGEVRVTLYTVDHSIVKFKPQIIDGENELEGSQIEGMILDDTELVGGKVPPSNPIKEGMEEQAAKNTMDPADETDDGNYVIQDVLQIGTNPANIYDENGLVIPPYDENGFILRLPVDEKYIFDDDNPYGYKEGDKVTVFWSGDDSGTIVELEAKLVPDDNGGLRAEIPYPYSADEDGNGIDDTGWPPLPGYFAIQYDTNKLPSGPGGSDVGYFKITAEAVGNGIVTPAGVKYWRVNTGENTGSALENAMYAFAPMGFSEKAYELTELIFANEEYGERFDLLVPGELDFVGGTLSALKTTLTLDNENTMFVPGSEWTLTAKFDTNTIPSENAKGTHSLRVSAKKKDGSDGAEYGGVVATYYDEQRTLTMKPESGSPAGIVSVNTMLNTSKATIGMVPAAPGGGMYYEATGIRMKVGSGDFEVQAFEQPFVVPATTENVEVEVIFEKFADTGLGGSQKSYTAKASVDEQSVGLGSVMTTVNGEFVSTPEYTVDFNDNSSFIPTIQFQGVDEDKYLSWVDVYVGERQACEHLTVNRAGDQLYSLILPNYHDNVTVVGHFTDVNAPTIRFSIEVKTEDSYIDNAGGGYSILGGGTIPEGMVRSLQRFPLLISPNEGYALASVIQTRNDGEEIETADLTSQVKGDVLSYIAIDGRPDISQPLDITLTITFRKADSSIGSVGDNEGKLSRVNTYVADATLTNDLGLSYAFTPKEGKFFINGDEASLSDAKNLSVQGCSADWGSVNGSPSLFGTAEYGSSYPLNLIGYTVDGQRYGVQKVLVVKYYYDTADDGIAIKEGLSWNLYDTNMPVFVLDNITTHTDVIAYFAPVGDGSSGTVKDNGFEDPADYCTVTANSEPMGKIDPYGAVKVLKGSSLPLNFTLSDPEYTLTSATVRTSGSSSRPITDALKAAGTSRTTYIMENLSANTWVTANYTEKPEADRNNYTVGAEVYLQEGAETNLVDADMSSKVCKITADGKLLVSNLGGVPLLEGKDFQFKLRRGSSYYKLNDLALTWSDPNVKAFVTKETVNGIDRNTVHFTTDEAAIVGRTLYESGTLLYGDGVEPANVTTEASWYVDNLACNITLVPTYEKLDRPPVPDTGDYWLLTTKVGTGFGQALVDSVDATGCITKVKKGSVTENEPLVISFVPAPGYRIKEVHVDTSTGNILDDFWSKVQGFLDEWQGRKTEQYMQEQAVSTGSITLQRMITNITIVVDYEIIPDVINPDTQLTDHVAVNVLYDPEKGDVIPSHGLVVNRNAEQQFVATPASVMETASDGSQTEMFYSVEAVRVSLGEDIPEEVSCIDDTSELVKWDPTYPNVFTVDFSKLPWDEDELGTAVTVEVLFSDEPDVERPSGSDPSVVPGTPQLKDEKQVIINVVTEGESSTDSNGIGGIVSPRGEFALVVPADPKDVDKAYKQRVDVLPGDDYYLDRLEVVSNNDKIDGRLLAYYYMLDLKEDRTGYFEVPADYVGVEEITVFFKLKPLSERTYSINVEARDTDQNHFIQPTDVITIENTQSQTYSIDPDLGYQVKSITDVAVDENGRESALPVDVDGKRGANWTRGADDEEAVNEVTIDPVRVNGKVVDRHVVIEFEAKEGVDHGLVKSERANLHVKAYGPGSEYLTFDPAGDMIGVAKGTETKHASYTYTFSLSQEGIDAGYGIYRVQGCGETVFGSPTNTTDLRTSGSFTFETENMTRENNNLNVYVKKPGAGPVDPGTDPVDPGTDPVDPGTDPVDPGTDPVGPGTDPNNPGKVVVVDFGCGNGGSIVDKSTNAKLVRAAGSEGDQLTGKLEVDPEKTFVLLITPHEGHVIDKLILDNCYVVLPQWQAPSDGRTAKIALESTMKVTDPTRSARVLATFAKGDADKFVPWDATQEDGRTYTVDGSFVVEIEPADGVEALVEIENGSAKAADMLDVSNPVAPFTPTTAKKLAAETDSSTARYEVTYDTISRLGEEKQVRILVGPLIKWNDEDNTKSTLYTIDNVVGLSEGYTVTEKPLEGASAVTGEEGEKPAYYSYYEIRGSLDEGTARNVMNAAPDGTAMLADNAASPQNAVVHIGLRSLQHSEGVYPEYMTLRPPTPQTVELRTQVLAGEGSIAPTTTTVSTSWYNGNQTGPWTVAKGTPVSFKVEPAAGYVLNTLSYDSINALTNGSFDAESGILTFQATTSTTVYARFAAKPSEEAMRTIVIEVDGDHGTTSPEPGTYKVEKGKPFSITFKAETGYVPYRIWVDGQESFVSPNLSGWMLPAWWDDQTFKVQYAAAGTYPDGGDRFIQTVQNVREQMSTTLAQTADNPWLPVVVLLLLLAGAAAFGGMRLVRAGEAATRAAKYSVTRRAVPREESQEPDRVEARDEGEERTDE